jgi:hypothetical protein
MLVMGVPWSIEQGIKTSSSEQRTINNFVATTTLFSPGGPRTTYTMEGPQEDVKWFGEGFDGFPKRLPEDCVEYMLFIIDSRLTQKEVLTRLETVRKEALKLNARLLKDYIWQREDFNLKLEQVNGKQTSLWAMRMYASY